MVYVTSRNSDTGVCSKHAGRVLRVGRATWHVETSSVAVPSLESSGAKDALFGPRHLQVK